MESGGAQGQTGSGGNRGGGMPGDSDKTSGGGDGGAAGKPVRKRHNYRPSTYGLPTPGASSSLAPRLNAAVAPFAPRSTTGQASVALAGSYPAVLKSRERDSAPGKLQIGILNTASTSPTTYATTQIVQPTETLGFGSVPCDAHQGSSQGLAPDDLSVAHPGGPGSKSPRPSLKYVAEFMRLEEARKKSKPTSDAKTAGTPSTIKDAFLAAPPTKSFLDFNAQTQAIVLANSRTAQGVQAKELSQISSGTVFKPNQELLNAAGPFKRIRSPAFPELQQERPSTSARVSATTPSQSFVGPSIEASGPTAGRVTVPIPIQSVLRPTTGALVPVSRRVTFSTPAALPVQVQASYITPPRDLIPYRNLSSNSGPRRALHMHSQSFSQPVTSLFSASCPPTRPQFVTPTKSSLNASQSLTQGSPLDRPNDTEEQKKKIDSVMSSFREVGDSYDSIEWLPNEGPASYSESPEPLTVPPQPVASYTTVGSLKPATNQQFTAPNRIQRDGTGRRAPQANLQGRGHDSHTGGRNVNQQYNPQYGAMNYSQYGPVNQPQFSSIQPHFGSVNQPQHDSTSQPRFSSPALPQHGNMSQSQYGVLNQSQYGAPTHSQYDSIHQRQYESENQTHYGSSTQSGFGSIHDLQILDGPPSMALTDAEKSVLQANGLSEPLMGNSRPSMRSGNIQQQHCDMAQKIDPSLNPKAESFNLQGQLKDNESGQTTFHQNSMPKVEKIQTMQSAALNTQHVAMSTGAHAMQQSAMTSTTSYGQTINVNNDQGIAGYENQGRGDFDHNYRFPPPGLVHPTQTNRSGAGYGQQTVSGFGSCEQVTTNQQHQMASGRPQPLTAGPPGQRQNAGFVTTGISSAQGIQVGSSQLSNVQRPPVLPPNSPWLPHNRNNMFTTVPMERSKIQDTLPPEELRQYYPNGVPSDMTGQYTRLPGAIDEGRPDMSEGEIKTEKTNKWFHAGVRNLNKTANDHLADMEKRNYNLEHGLPPQPPSTLDDYGNPLSIKEIVAMSEPEVAAHLLNPLFGNTLKLADQRSGPNNLSMLSRYAPGAPWVIDNSEQGNRSFFGEDWGPTPRRVGRDPRYQPFE